MKNYLGRLAGRSLGLIKTIKPRVPSIFEPIETIGEGASKFDRETVDVEAAFITDSKASQENPTHANHFEMAKHTRARRLPDIHQHLTDPQNQFDGISRSPYTSRAEVRYDIMRHGSSPKIRAEPNEEKSHLNRRSVTEFSTRRARFNHGNGKGYSEAAAGDYLSEEPPLKHELSSVSDIISGGFDSSSGSPQIANDSNVQSIDHLDEESTFNNHDTKSIVPIKAMSKEDATLKPLLKDRPYKAISDAQNASRGEGVTGSSGIKLVAHSGKKSLLDHNEDGDTNILKAGIGANFLRKIPPNDKSNITAKGYLEQISVPSPQINPDQNRRAKSMPTAMIVKDDPLNLRFSGSENISISDRLHHTRDETMPAAWRVSKRHPRSINRPQVRTSQQKTTVRLHAPVPMPSGKETIAPDHAANGTSIDYMPLPVLSMPLRKRRNKQFPQKSLQENSRTNAEGHLTLRLAAEGHTASQTALHIDAVQAPVSSCYVRNNSHNTDLHIQSKKTRAFAFKKKTLQSQEESDFQDSIAFSTLNPDLPMVRAILPAYRSKAGAAGMNAQGRPIIRPERSESDVAHEVKVTIGRIEVRANVSPQPKSKKRDPPQTVGLDEYLLERSGGKR
jgi:hypothetical protein